jgi:hypothetical protein
MTSKLMLLLVPVAAAAAASARIETDGRCGIE